MVAKSFVNLLRNLRLVELEDWLNMADSPLLKAFLNVGIIVALFVPDLTKLEVIYMSNNVEKLNSQNFSEFTGSGTVLVDFWAPWCGPCQMQLPILDVVARKIGSQAKVGKINVEESPDIASKFSIFSIPTLIVFKDGTPAKVFQGVQSEDTLVKALA